MNECPTLVKNRVELIHIINNIYINFHLSLGFCYYFCIVYYKHEQNNVKNSSLFSFDMYTDHLHCNGHNFTLNNDSTAYYVANVQHQITQALPVTFPAVMKWY
jgi:hypothetical protein